MDLILKFIGLFLFLVLLLISPKSKFKKNKFGKKGSDGRSEYGITEDGVIALMTDEKEY